jgi:hypothetical protein
MKLPAVAVDRKGNRTMKVAPVRRETPLEGIARRHDELPTFNVCKLLTNRRGKAKRPYYPSDVLIPGEAKFVQTPTNYPI